MSSDSRLVPRCRSGLFLLAMLVFALRLSWTAHAMLPLCSEVCEVGVSCGEQCIDDSDNLSDCGDYNAGATNGECTASVCGNGLCEWDEHCSCEADCGASQCPQPTCMPGTTCNNGSGTWSMNCVCVAYGSGGDGSPNQDPDCTANGWACVDDSDCCSGLSCVDVSNGNGDYECTAIHIEG